jgi:hypothetical protein
MVAGTQSTHVSTTAADALDVRIATNGIGCSRSTPPRLYACCKHDRPSTWPKDCGRFSALQAPDLGGFLEGQQ